MMRVSVVLLVALAGVLDAKPLVLEHQKIKSLEFSDASMTPWLKAQLKDQAQGLRIYIDGEPSEEDKSHCPWEVTLTRNRSGDLYNVMRNNLSMGQVKVNFVSSFKDEAKLKKIVLAFFGGERGKLIRRLMAVSDDRLLKELSAWKRENNGATIQSFAESYVESRTGNKVRK